MMCLKKGVCACCRVCAEGRRQLCGVSSMSPCGFPALDLGCQLAWQAPLSVEKSHCPILYFWNLNISQELGLY